ncbi:nucleotide exchange factor GrpE [Candidatus Babeliales bacterium]|nr:nucleotide exchange factor GrpE [Candidatus Babeliales bacterium]
MNLDQNHQDQDDAQLHQNEQNKNENNSESHDQALKCMAELSMWQDQCKRISAEFENFKRRVDKDKARWSEMAKESVLLDLLPFVDTFDAALQQKNGTDLTGIEMMYQTLLKLLHKHEVSMMQQTKDFDPEFHEAVMQVQSEKYASGEVVEILSKGFMIKDRVLRPAKVSVAV